MVSLRFRDGFRAKVAPEVVEREFSRIESKYGDVTASSLFEESRPADAALHGEYIWDGETAVRELGLIRSREIFRAVIVVPDETEKQPYHLLVHIPSSDPEQREGHYERMEVAAQSVDLFARAQAGLLQKFQSALTSLDELKQLASDQPARLRAINAASKKVGAAKEAVAALA